MNPKTTCKHNPALTGNARALRKNMTKQEKHLWYDYLQGYPIRFLKQKVIDGYIVDFYCHRARLAIELDGSQHYTEKGVIKDCIKASTIEKRNIMVLHIPNQMVDDHFDSVCQYINSVVLDRIDK